MAYILQTLKTLWPHFIIKRREFIGILHKKISIERVLLQEPLSMVKVMLSDASI